MRSCGVYIILILTHVYIPVDMYTHVLNIHTCMHMYMNHAPKGGLLIEPGTDVHSFQNKESDNVYTS